MTFAVSPASVLAQPVSAWKAWVMAMRPKTLTAGAVPVGVGTALAYAQGLAKPLPALAALVGALLIQIGTNLTNDYYDFRRGADTVHRLGPTRVTQSGLIEPSRVLGGALLCFGLAMFTGIYLVAVAGVPILLVGLVSILAGYAYTGGPFPLGYHGLGDVFVFVFFGLVAVEGTFYVQAHAFSWTVLCAAIPVGATGVALLAVNNLRDIPTDAAAGKRTLAVRFGERFAKREYVVALLLSFAVPLALVLSRRVAPAALLALLAMPAAIAPWKRVRGKNGAGSELNRALAETAKLQLLQGCLFALGIGWGGR